MNLITQEQRNNVLALDTIVRETSRAVIEAEKSGSEMLKAVTMARSMNALREGLTPLMGDIMQIVGTPMGFRTDKDRPRLKDGKWDDSKYSVEQVRDVVIVALLRGFRVVGNEFNIIAGNFYATKEGMRRFVLEFPGLKNFRIETEVPATMGGGALVGAVVTWNLNGIDDRLEMTVTKDGDVTHDRRVAVRANDGMGIDAIIGKAESKIYRRVYAILTGTELPDDDSPSEDPVDDQSSIVGSSVESAATNSSDNSGDSKDSQDAFDETILDEYRAGLAAAETPGDARKLYDAWFGPESSKEWPSGADGRAAKLMADREEEIRQTRGKNSNKKRQQQMV